MNAFIKNGWVLIPHAQEIADWVSAVTPCALSAVNDPANAHWLRCGGTWFVGVNALNNTSDGSVAGAGPLPGPIRDTLTKLNLEHDALDRAQVSVIYPGYPKPSAAESDAAFKFRKDRDAAHVDGLLPVSKARLRMLKEPHGFVLGIALTEVSADASPMVVWEGSHHIMRRALGEILLPHPPKDWPTIDLTNVYQKARREVFETCTRLTVPTRPGSAYIIHRLTLHGVAPWANTATASPMGRAIAYFRPELPGLSTDWITAP